MRIVSWNVAGINACMKKGFLDFLRQNNAEICCLQEVKATREKMPEFIKGYHAFHVYPERKGYSGVSVLTKIEPYAVLEGLGIEEFDKEGRVLTLEFKDFFLINAYFPHSHRELTRLDFKMRFNEEFGRFCDKLSKMKPIVIASDFNVAHTEIDLANPKSNMKNAGFTSDERKWFDNFLKKGYLDSFREFVKEGGHYTWWTYRNDARKRNIGWRIDYFVISPELRSRVKKSEILKEILGSDHCPIIIDIQD